MKNKTDNCCEYLVENVSQLQNATDLEITSKLEKYDTSECCFQDQFLGTKPKDTAEYIHQMPARQECFKFCS